ncbi:WYL domain-containing protein [Vibrio fluvialis]
MEKFKWFLASFLMAVSISLVSLIIAVVNFSAGFGVFIWLIATAFAILFSVKFWKKKVATLPKLKPGENRWQGWQQVNTSTSSSYSESDEDEARRAFNKRPWDQRKDILWKGKRNATITYTDRNGDVTERSITMYGIMPSYEGEITLVAMCHLRDDWRTFYIDKIIQITTAKNKIYGDFSEYMSTELGI